MFKKLFKLIKPTSLFGRGLIMILAPLLAIQIIVGTLVIQRYFYDVINQLDNLVIDNIKLAKTLGKSDEQIKDILNQMELITSSQPMLTQNQYGYFEISGRIIRSNFAKEYGEPVFVASDDEFKIQLSIPNSNPPLNLEIKRSKLAPINPHQIMLNMIGSSILLGLVSIFFLRNQVRSLRKLSLTAKAFGRGEILDFTPSGGDEVRSAGLSFLAMRKRIIRQREQRNLMLSGVSHDLRTPLTRMKLSVAMLENEDERYALAQDIEAIEVLADSFLSYASNDAVENYQNVDLLTFLTDICRHVPKVKLAGDARIMTRIRPILFRRGIENLLNNSNRYANNINVNVSVREKTLHIYIDDDGPGIPPHLRDEATKAFTRLDVSRNQNEGGHVGLGLAIAADAIRQHGGDLNLDQSPLGGLRVSIALPLKLPEI